MKAELTELVIISGDIRKQMIRVLSEAATVRGINKEVCIMRGELQQARAANEAVQATAEITASKLTFLDPGDESLFL